jgi:type I restriction enzyme, S subunit
MKRSPPTLRVWVLMGEWREIALGDLADIYDGPHATPKRTLSGPIFLGISNLSNGRIELGETSHVSEADFARWTRRVTPTVGDVVFSYETRLGEAAIVPEGLRCCLGRRMGLLRAKPARVLPRFLLYAYLSPAFQETLRAATVHGSTVDRIPLIDLPTFPIRIATDMREQQRIAEILGALDDKIELNRRMSGTLEAIARALFRSWFVDFDPVRAKADAAMPAWRHISPTCSPTRSRSRRSVAFPADGRASPSAITSRRYEASRTTELV